MEVEAKTSQPCMSSHSRATEHQRTGTVIEGRWAVPKRMPATTGARCRVSRSATVTPLRVLS
eukprot:7305545-Alexandrium_andersonii.AAC.1